MAKENYIPDFHSDIGKDFVYVPLVRKFTGERELRLRGSSIGEISIGTLKSLFLASCKYSVAGEDEVREIKFLLKYREPLGREVPVLLRRDSKNRAREARYYRFLEGIGCVPQAFLIEDILKREGIDGDQLTEYTNQLKLFPNAIILRYVGDTTLDKKLRETKNDDRHARKEIIRRVLEQIIDFQIEATQKPTSPVTPQNGLGDLFAERPNEARIVDYTRALMQFDKVTDLPRDLIDRIKKDWAPVTRSYEKTMPIRFVVHGDLIASNIVIGKDQEGKENYYFIDPQLKERDPFIDPSSLLSSPGTVLGTDNWEEIAQEFRLTQIRKMGAKGWWLSWDRETEKTVLNFIYNRIFQYSLRNLAVAEEVERLFQGSYRGNSLEDKAEMRCNIREALDKLINEAERLGVTQEDAALYDDFRRILQDVSVLERKQNPEENQIKTKAIIEIAKARVVRKSEVPA